MNQESTEKLQKVLARAGFGSRRELEGWIEKGRVKVNGKVAQLGIRVSESDRVVVDGKKLNPAEIREMHADSTPQKYIETIVPAVAAFYNKLKGTPTS